MNSPFIERDISWLAFNHRVLQEAQDKTVPLYERIKFLAIYSSNLDEFFRVRVASLRSFRQLKKSTKKEMNLRPRKLLKEIRRIVQNQQSEFGKTFREEILPELARNGIHLVNETQFNGEQRAFAKQYFDEKIAPHLQAVFPAEAGDAPFLQNKSLYLALYFEGETPPALLPLPVEKIGRFIMLPPNSDGHFVTFMDDVTRLGLQSFFPEKKLAGAYAVKLSRDAELYIDDEFSGDLVEKIKQGLQVRHVGLPTRFLYDAAMPEALLDWLKNTFSLTKNDLIPGARYHNFNDFFGFPNPADLDELHDPPMPPLPHPTLPAPGTSSGLLNTIAESDCLLHFPYQQYDYVTRLVEEAAGDPAVDSLKITLYRVAGKSAICEGLLTALRNGKKVMAFIEAKARFDEETNLFWGEKLEAAGAFVLYSFPGIKVHSKMLLIARNEVGSMKNYAYLGTGNFNEKTALLYGDHAILTADERMADEVAQVFDVLEGKRLIPKTKHLLVAPFSLRSGLEALIDKEIVAAKKGNDAGMILKLNSLEDRKMMDKLIEASQAGVRIRMIVRGICCLAPGVKGFTENIEITSLVDRFLEHARVYIFANGGNEKMYLASADWMGRNLDRRVEVAFPVLSESLHREIRQIIDFQLNDNVKTRFIDAENDNRFRIRKEGEAALRAQVETYRMCSVRLNPGSGG